jgi:hypothetical protein
MLEAVSRAPLIDYASHPAFRPYVEESAEANAAVAEAIRKADAALEQIHGSAALLPVPEIESIYRSRVLPELDAIARVCAAKLSPELPIAKVAAAAVAECREELLKAACFENDKKRPWRGGRLLPAAERVADDLSLRGISLHHMPQATLDAIEADVGRLRGRLLEQSQRNGGDRCALALPPSGAYWAEITNFLQKSGILGGCSYSRRELLEPAHCGLVFSHDGERWWQDCYADVGIRTTRTVYMHNDKDFDYMKVMIYLGRVDETQGPFCFVPGSHRWQRSRTQSFFFKALDSALNANFAPREPVRTVYYRKAYHHPEFRRQLMLLPAPLRGSSHFGDDVLDDAEQAKFLLAQELTITTDVANCMAFIGADGIHRGGTVTQGSRWALQLFMHRLPPVHRRIERSTKAAYGKARSTLRGAVRRMIGDRGIQAARSLAGRLAGR